MDEALSKWKRQLEAFQQQLDVEPLGEKRDALLLELRSVRQKMEALARQSAEFRSALQKVKNAMNSLVKRKPKTGA